MNWKHVPSASHLLETARRKLLKLEKKKEDKFSDRTWAWSKKSLSQWKHQAWPHVQLVCPEFSPKWKERGWNQNLKCRCGKTKKPELLKSEVVQELVYGYGGSWIPDCSSGCLLTGAFCVMWEGDPALGGCIQLPSTYQTAQCILPAGYGHCKTGSAHDEFYWRSRSYHSLRCSSSQYRTLRK